MPEGRGDVTPSEEEAMVLASRCVAGRLSHEGLGGQPHACEMAYYRYSIMKVSDACAVKGAIGVCSWNGRRGLTAAIPTDLVHDYARSHDAQQTAELYVAVACAAASTDAPPPAVTHQCLRGFSGLLPPSRHWAAAILQMVTVRRVPGPMNVVDSWSRSTPTG